MNRSKFEKYIDTLSKKERVRMIPEMITLRGEIFYDSWTGRPSPINLWYQLHIHKGVFSYKAVYNSICPTLCNINGERDTLLRLYDRGSLLTTPPNE